MDQTGRTQSLNYQRASPRETPNRAAGTTAFWAAMVALGAAGGLALSIWFGRAVRPALPFYGVMVLASVVAAVSGAGNLTRRQVNVRSLVGFVVGLVLLMLSAMVLAWASMFLDFPWGQ